MLEVWEGQEMDGEKGEHSKNIQRESCFGGRYDGSTAIYALDRF